ncbi:cation:dicarboxylate symporter family transporter [Clostridium rectalis]|uniref:cation:dicarboxylate symporter family transporter n=1 Tax=Clostridium rectalis TaxID=2040295 RepID=UPI003C12C1F3
MGQAGVPSLTLLVISTLITAKISVVGLPILFGADKLFDMLKTAINVPSTASCAIVLDNLN